MDQGVIYSSMRGQCLIDSEGVVTVTHPLHHPLSVEQVVIGEIV